MDFEDFHRLVNATPLWRLDIVSIIVFPLVSLVANSIGHMNYAVFPHKSTGDLLAACQRHTAHHTRWAGNYGFYLPWLDRWLSTRLPRRADASRQQRRVARS